MDMRGYAAEKRSHIETALREAFPREPSDQWLANSIGSARYSSDMQVWTKMHDMFFDLVERGGKRLRPLLTCLVYEASYGRGLGDDIYRLASIPEILHNGTLIVDDIEDGSEMRRGLPSIHKRYGIARAVNAGNLVFFLPASVLESCRNVGETEKRTIKSIIDKEMLRLHLGQGMDIEWSHEHRYDLSADEYLQMTCNKTGSMLGIAMKIGAVVASRNEDALDDIGSIADHMGVAFQIRDDYLNLKPSGDWGKEHGEDITEGKLTYMAVHSFANAGSRDRNRLGKILASGTTSPRKIQQAISIMEGCDAFSAAMQCACTHAEKAKTIADNCFYETEHKAVLLEIIDYTVSRHK